MIPWSAFVYVEWCTRAHRNHRFSLWIPLFLAWLLLLPLVLILFPVVALACLFIRVNVLRLYSTAWGILAALGQTRVEVRTPATRILVDVA
ncbi:MAG TPA: hypothetical protein VMD25_06995 [Acidobacteriaceae bacterium]|nr:hypothetical protein [Acidobacteriaceae bacterium]